MTQDPRLYAPAAARNRDPILAALRPQLPQRGLILEIASGTGEHIVHFASQYGPELTFQPSDPAPTARASIDAWSAASGAKNVRPAIALNAASAHWPVDHADAVLCINMVHISPWPATIGLVNGAARILPENGFLYLYGAFRRNGRHTALSNERFDADLRQRNNEWGVRDLEDVAALAANAGFEPPQLLDMPANNLSVFFRRKNASIDT